MRDTRHATAQAVGYVALPADCDDQERQALLARTGAGLAAHAAGHGYALTGVFTDVRDRSESGLYHLLSAVRQGQATAVVTPGLDHLQHAGCLRGADARTASRYLRARLLASDPVHDGPDQPVPAHPWGAARCCRVERRAVTCTRVLRPVPLSRCWTRCCCVGCSPDWRVCRERDE